VKKKVSEEESKTINPSMHIYVPKHEIVAEKEKETVVNSFHCTPDQFPQILISDPVARELGAKLGDLIKITRKSQTAGESVYYRFVVVA